MLWFPFWNWLKKQLGGTASTYWEKLLSTLQEAFTWLIDWLKDLAHDLTMPAVQAIGDMIPDTWNGGIATAITWGNYLDTWLPVNLAVQLFLTYYLIKATLLAVKYVLKATPTIW